MSGLILSLPSDCEFLLRKYQILFIFVLTYKCIINKCYTVILTVIKSILCEKHTESKSTRIRGILGKWFSDVGLMRIVGKVVGWWGEAC